MSGKNAALVLCGVCVVLATLLVSGSIKPIVSGGVFAGALLVLGVASGGFRKPGAAK